MKKHFFKSFLLTCILFSTAIGFAQNSVSDLNYLVNQTYSSAKSQLGRNGYTYCTRNSSGSYTYENWFNSRKSQCVTLSIYKSRIKSIKPTSDSACDKSNGGGFGGNGGSNNNNGSGNFGGNGGSNNNNGSGNFGGNGGSGNHGNHGNHDRVNYSDLVFKPSNYAYDQLRKRGFNEIKNSQSDGITYRLWFNDDTRQCIKSSSKDKKIASIVISDHCKM